MYIIIYIFISTYFNRNAYKLTNLNVYTKRTNFNKRTVQYKITNFQNIRIFQTFKY